MKRLHMPTADKRWFVEAEETPAGRTWLESLRRRDPRFKRQRIKAVLQLRPSAVAVQRLYRYTEAGDPGYDNPGLPL